MSLPEYLKDKKILILLYLSASLFTGVMLYMVESFPYSGPVNPFRSCGLYTMTVCLFLFAVCLTVDFLCKRDYYSKLKQAAFSQSLDWIHSLPRPINAEQRIHQELLQKLYRDATGKIAEYTLKNTEDLEFVTTWVHEIKTPIAASKLIIENSLNHPSEKDLFSIEDEIVKIEDFVQMTLFYARAGDFSRDYMISSVRLEKIVHDCIKTEYSNITGKRLRITMSHLDLDIDSDEKWLHFILKQILDNAVKYSSPDKEIRIYTSCTEQERVLIFEDTGIGIRQTDISRIFDKNFTGTNGRKYNSSTGIGLYLSRKLARRLGHDITVESDYGHGTKISVHFPIWTSVFSE